MGIYAAKEQYLTNDTTARNDLEKFEAIRKNLNEILGLFSQQAEAAMNEKEEKTKVLLMASDAKIESLNGTLEELFNQNYPLVVGSAALADFTMHLQDILHSYLLESEPDNLEGIGKTFEKTARKFENKQRVLKGRLINDDIKTTFDAIAGKFQEMTDTVLAEKGMFHIHQDSLRLKGDLNRLKSDLESKNIELLEINRRIKDFARNLNEQSQAQSNPNVANAQIILQVIILTGGVVSLIAGVDQAIRLTATHSSQSQKLGEELAKIAQTLVELVSHFQI